MWHKAPCSSRDYSGVRESGPLKRDEEGDEDGDVDEDDHRGDGSPSSTPTPPRERRRSSPRASSSMASPLDGERFSLWSLCWKYALEAIIKWLLLYFLVHDNCLLFMLQLY